MPTIIDTSYSDGECDEWLDWMNSHLCTREDGTWLSDRRDPTPSKRSKWLEEESRSPYVWYLGNDLFVEALRELSPLSNSLVVDGDWKDYKGHSSYMRTSVRSAFVSVETSTSLAEYLKRAEDYMCCFPHSQHQSISRKFRIIRPSFRVDPRSSGRDEYDPYANDIHFPPIELSPQIAKSFGLTCDTAKRTWQLGKTGPVAASMVWQDPRPFHQDDNRRRGLQLSVDLELLKQCCIQYESDLVIIVTIDRGEAERYRRNSSYTDERIPASRKVYLFRNDGSLRET